jgi:hypothetical protein
MTFTDHLRTLDTEIRNAELSAENNPRSLPHYEYLRGLTRARTILTGGQPPPARIPKHWNRHAT